MTPYALPKPTRTSRLTRRRRHGRMLLDMGCMMAAMVVTMLVIN